MSKIITILIELMSATLEWLHTNLDGIIVSIVAAVILSLIHYIKNKPKEINEPLPENFRQPFFAKNAGDFWRRWHITLGAWLKDYVFYPISLAKPVKNLAKKIKKKAGFSVSKFVAVEAAVETKQDGKVVVRSYERLDCFAIQIVDNGNGVSPVKKFRAKQDFRGLQKQLKSSVGALIEVRTKPDKGTILTVKIPKQGYVIKE